MSAKVSTSPNHERRIVLKIAASASIGGLASATIPGVGLTSSERAYDVIVVGAGMAGLYAARELLSKGYRVRVLEAADRHGGRIHSATLGETRIELGAEEHYLGRNNPIYEAVVNAFGSDVYAETYVGEEMISMDGGRTCWEETGDCEDDADIRNYWEYLEYWENYANPGGHEDFTVTMADDVYTRYGVDRNHRAYHLFDNGIAGSVFGTSLQEISTKNEDLVIVQEAKLKCRRISPRQKQLGNIDSEEYPNGVPVDIQKSTAID